MKILPLVTGIKNDITSSGIRMKKASAEGYNIALRASKVYKQGSFKKYLNVTRSVTHKVLSGTTKQELPYLAGAIGLMLPIPFMCPILFGIGLLIRIPSTGADIIYDKQSKSHINING